MSKASLTSVLAGFLISFCLPLPVRAEQQKPNVLFIIVDDLNDWLSCMKGHPQTRTPNMDRLAANGVLFTDAHCQAPLCGPSRTSLWYGRRPSTTGVYANYPQEYKKIPTLQGVKIMPAYFAENGYATLGIGKILHNGYKPYPTKTEFQISGPVEEDPFGSCPAKKIHTPDGAGKDNPGYDWGFPYASDEETLDYIRATWAIDQIRKARKEPFFLAIGMTKTHLPHFSAKEYQKQFPLETIQLPPILESDLDDVPAFGRALNVAPAMPSHAWVTANHQLPEMVQAYLACVATVDKQVGRVLDALQASGKADSTIIVLTSDNGMHRGEKEQYEKFTIWNRSTHVPLIISVPGGVKGGRCEDPVELLDVYPTLLDLCGLPPLAGLEGLSLRPQLENPSCPRERPALTTWYPNNHSVQTKEWNYIRYADGTEELYDKRKDPNEWTNLAGTDTAKKIIPELSRWMPSHCATPVPGSDYIAVPQVVRDREDWPKD